MILYFPNWFFQYVARKQLFGIQQVILKTLFPSTLISNTSAEICNLKLYFQMFLVSI